MKFEDVYGSAGRLKDYFITENREGHKSCLSYSLALHISCWKCLRQKKNTLVSRISHTAALPSLSRSPTSFTCFGKALNFTATSTLGDFSEPNVDIKSNFCGKKIRTFLNYYYAQIYF